MPELPDVLVRILERSAQRVAAAKAGGAAVSRPAAAPAENAFLAAIRARRGHAVIAEVKLGSPKLGSLVDRVDPERQAVAYAENGAAALSVVVEPEFFHGSYDLLRRCREASGLPAVAKDFVLDEIQLDWARDAGADAVLLIAAALEAERLRELAAAARRRGLVPLVETHDDSDLEKLDEPAADGHGWELVGVNNRDLRTFSVDLERSIAMLPRLPAAAIKVAESGIRDGADLAHLSASGFDAFLIGESLLLADDVAAKLAELLSQVPSGERA